MRLGGSLCLQVPTAEQVKHDDLTEALASFQQQLAEVGFATGLLLAELGSIFSMCRATGL
jgi:hypothetical protein